MTRCQVLIATQSLFDHVFQTSVHQIGAPLTTVSLLLRARFGYKNSLQSQ